MKNQQQKIKIASFILLIQTIIWIIFTGISMSQVNSSWVDSDFIKWAANPDIFFVGNYINATLLTITVILLFSFLFIYLKTKYESMAIIGIVFIPIYGVINLLCYSLQITIVPAIAGNSMNNLAAIDIASQLIQANSKSLIGFLNGLAYTLLGIPSIIYGLLLIKELKKYSGFFLLLNGILCIIGIIGYLLGNNILSKGMMIGGIIFLLSLLFMIIEFKYNE
jgi:hypothetical protein